jgi:serine/threonine protein phosphatase PrpC
LHGLVNDDRIAEVLGTEHSIEEKAHILVENARQAGGPDNITAVILRTVNSGMG